MPDRPTCCWTHCDNEQGRGTWTEITTSDGPFTLPVCEEHWYGNWATEKANLKKQINVLKTKLGSALAQRDQEAGYDGRRANEAVQEKERLRTLVNEHHNVRHWIEGSDAQHRVGIALWGTPCAVCDAIGGVGRVEMYNDEQAPVPIADRITLDDMGVGRDG